MPTNTPIPDAELAELRRLHAAATPGEWESTTYSNYAGWSVWAPNGAGCIAERWYPVGTEDEIPRNDLWIAAIHNALPGLLDELEELRRGEDRREDEDSEYMELLRAKLGKRDVHGIADGIEQLADRVRAAESERNKSIAAELRRIGTTIAAGGRSFAGQVARVDLIARAEELEKL